MAKIYKLRALIYSKYDSESQLATALGWSRQRLSRITNGMKEPDLDDIRALADKLGASVPEIVDIFLSVKSPNDVQTG